MRIEPLTLTVTTSQPLSSMRACKSETAASVFSAGPESHSANVVGLVEFCTELYRKSGNKDHNVDEKDGQKGT